jgi:hypothetical protein
MKSKELTTVARSWREPACSQEMWQAGCEDAVERGAEKNTAHFARYLHGDPPADRHLERDGRKSKVGRIPSGQDQREASTVSLAFHVFSWDWPQAANRDFATALGLAEKNFPFVLSRAKMHVSYI